jgi:hypothetical protein
MGGAKGACSGKREVRQSGWTATVLGRSHEGAGGVRRPPTGSRKRHRASTMRTTAMTPATSPAMARAHRAVCRAPKAGDLEHEAPGCHRSPAAAGPAAPTGAQCQDWRTRVRQRPAGRSVLGGPARQHGHADNGPGPDCDAELVGGSTGVSRTAGEVTASSSLVRQDLSHTGRGAPRKSSLRLP